MKHTIQTKKESTNIFDCNGKEILLESRVMTDKDEYGTVVFHEGNYMIKLDVQYVRINRLCEVVRKNINNQNK